MPTIDTRHSEMDGLFTLRCIEEGLTPIKLAIVQAKASMEEEDIKHVEEKLKELLKDRG
jgi:hypothetical protein